MGRAFSVAKLEDIPAEHRGNAARMRHADSMPVEEIVHRSKHVSSLESKAPMTGEARNLVFAHTSRLLSALPVREYLDRVGHLNELAGQLPAGIDGAGHDARQAAFKVKADNTYAPGLVHACEQRRLGKTAPFDGADIDAILGLETQKATAPKAPRDPIAKAVAEALKGLDAKERQLRKEINDWKAKMAADYISAGLPVPKHLNVPPEMHPNAPAAARLERQAEEYRRTAESLSEPELRMHFMAKAKAAEEEAEEIKRGINGR
jgi:hypothetical protein